MADVLAVVPQLTAVLEHRKASSSCCGAKLNPLPARSLRRHLPARWRLIFACRECGRPCERVLGDPVEVTAHG